MPFFGIFCFIWLLPFLGAVLCLFAHFFTRILFTQITFWIRKLDCSRKIETAAPTPSYLEFRLYGATFQNPEKVLKVSPTQA